MNHISDKTPIANHSPAHSDGSDTSNAQPPQHGGISRFAHSRAVIIGIDHYQHIRPLNAAVSDARRLAECLREQHGYDDVLLLEDTKREILATELGERLAVRTNQDDRLLLYFAGHGIALDGDDGPKGFLIPADAMADDRETFVAMSDLYTWLEALPCRHLLVILDCCFAGAFTWYGHRSIRPIGAKLYREHYDRFIREPAWQIITSAAHDQEALDVLDGRPIGERGEHEANGVRHSPFADAFYAALQGEGDLIPKGEGDGVITATELYLYLRQVVETSAEEQAKHRQTPELWPFSRTRHGKGEYIFLVPGHSEPDLEPAPELTTENNPYRGLQSYDEEHAALFYGRRALIEKLTAAVDEHPLTVVLGASGTGKSSVVKAGVVPHLRQKTGESSFDDAKKRSEDLLAYEILPPIRPTDAPLRVLKELVKANLGGCPEQPGNFQPADFIASTITSWLDEHPHKRLLLVVDQLEELVTLCRNDAVRRDFLQTLADLPAKHPDRVRIILTLRTDFEPQFQDSPLNDQWQEGRCIIPPMSQSELREVIEAPATASALFFDPPELVDTLIDEVIQAPSALPLLSFTLEQLYLKYIDRQSEAQRDGVILERSLTQADYAALGGVIGSLRRRADEIYDALPDDAFRATMRRVMLRMVAVEGSELARRRVTRSELIYSSRIENARVQTVIDRLVEARLLVTNSLAAEANSSEGAYVEPAHDALVLAWDKLLRWKKESHDFLPLQRRLTQAASEWDKATSATKSGMLWESDPRLPQVEETLWPTRDKYDGLLGRVQWAMQVLMPRRTKPRDTQWINALELSFVQASVEARAGFWRRVVMTTAAFVLILSGATVVSLWLQARAMAAEKTAVEEAARARSAEMTAVANQQIATENQAKAEKEASRARAGEISALSSAIESKDPELAALLALYALENEEFTPNAETALRNALQNIHISRRYPHGIDDVSSAAFDPRGQYYAIGSSSGEVRIYDEQVPSTPIQTMQLSRWVRSLDFSGTGRPILAGGDMDGRLFVWDVLKAEMVLSTTVSPAVANVALSPDGEHLAVITGNQKIGRYKTRFWEISESRELTPEVTFNADIIAYHPARNFIALNGSGEDANTLAIFTTDLETEVARWSVIDPDLYSASDGGMVDLAFSPDGNLLVSAGGDGIIRLWDTTDLSAPHLHRALQRHAGPVWHIDFDRSGKCIIASGQDHLITVWTTDGELITELRGHHDHVQGATFLRTDASPTPDCPDRYRSVADDQYTIDWMLATKEYATVQANTGRVEDLAFTLDRDLLVAGGEDGTITVRTASDLQEVHSHSLPVPVNAVAISQDGRWLGAVDDSGNLTIWSLIDNQMFSQNRVADSPLFDLAFSPRDVGKIAVAGSDGTIYLVEDGIVTQHWWVTNRYALSVAFTSDGMHILAGTGEGFSAVIALQTSEPTWIYVGPSNVFVYQALPVPHSDDIVAVDSQGVISFWSLTTNAASSPSISGHAGSIRDIAFTHDGAKFATVDANGETIVWDTQTKQQIVRLPARRAGLTAVAFDADDRFVATAAEDGSVRIYYVQWNDLVAAARQRVSRSLSQNECQTYNLRCTETN